jgi:hypothetical protein
MAFDCGIWWLMQLQMCCILLLSNNSIC